MAHTQGTEEGISSVMTDGENMMEILQYNRSCFRNAAFIMLHYTCTHASVHTLASYLYHLSDLVVKYLAARIWQKNFCQTIEAFQNAAFWCFSAHTHTHIYVYVGFKLSFWYGGKYLSTELTFGLCYMAIIPFLKDSMCCIVYIYISLSCLYSFMGCSYNSSLTRVIHDTRIRPRAVTHRVLR